MGKTRTTIVKEAGDIKMFARSGIVHGSKTWTSQEIYSSGGGGHIGPHGGRIHENKISSTTTTHKAFFLVDDKGKETEIELSDSSFGFRDGHYVTVVYSGHKNDDFKWLSHLHNHNTDQSTQRSSAYRKIVGNPKVWIFYMAMLAATTFGILAQSWTLFILIMAGYAGYTLLIESPKLQALKDEINRQANELIKERIAIADEAGAA